ncbi:hypothetical protein [Actinocrispum wychmicini]|uniref:Uncharacterized protein n=1 Tax=Actinocrispum wychmicini TaxID=1213861 RepID=A0A4R2JBI1_9PSEU|nr:hypothetical protein [Actinocrispum wychmicini]TCO54106.1 hypothetical protein EV192_10986 [Actinocrispum wychmicini]
MTSDMRRTAEALADSFATHLPADEVEQYRRFVFAGEWEELAYAILGYLRAKQVPVTGGERDLLRDLLYGFELPRPGYPLLSKRDQYMTELTIMDPATE